MGIGVENEVFTAKSADQHKQRGFGKVEVGQERADHLKPKSGIDEEIGVAGAGTDFARILQRCEFESTDGCGADGDDAAVGGAGSVDLCGCGGRDGIVLGVKMMIFDGRHVDRLESAESDVERDFRGFDVAIAQAGENFSSEVKSCGRGGYGSALTSIDGLIAVAIGGGIGTRNVGRKRNVADGIEGSEEILAGREADMALAEFSAGDDLGLELVVSVFGRAEEKMLADGDLAPRADKTFPFIGIMAELASKEDLGPSVEKIPCGGIPRANGLRVESGATRIETRRKDARVVEDNEIVGTEKMGEIAELAVGKCFVSCAYVEQARGGTVGEGLLGNEFRGKIEVEIGDQHGFRL